MCLSDPSRVLNLCPLLEQSPYMLSHPSGAETCFVVVVVCFYATVLWYIPQRTQAAAPGASRYRIPEEGLDCGWHWVKSYEKRAQHMRNSFFF